MTEEVLRKESSIIAQRHEAEALLQEALEKQARARTWLGRFVASKLVNCRERQADEFVRSGVID